MGCACVALLAENVTKGIALFNGKDLAGFYTWLVDTKREDPRHVFTVTNGMIHISGEGLGYLATESEYRNYHLSIEFKWGTESRSWGDRAGKARDSGILLHAIGPDGNSDDGHGAFASDIGKVPEAVRRLATSVVVFEGRQSTIYG